MRPDRATFALFGGNRAAYIETWPSGLSPAWCEFCTWCWHDGAMRLKVVNSNCPAHRQAGNTERTTAR